MQGIADKDKALLELHRQGLVPSSILALQAFGLVNCPVILEDAEASSHW